MTAVVWRCPACADELAGEELSGVVSLRCAQGHAYDVAREGYVNLLRGDRPYKFMGDSKAMLAARRRFLARGGYEPLRRRLHQLLAGMNTEVVLETGCGEGYYIGGLSEQLISSKCLGYDLSKEAAKMASKAYTKPKFAVADTFKNLPLADGSVSVILDIFAPRNAQEFRRIVQPAGWLIVVVPAAGHLAELREQLPLLAVQPEKRQAVEAALTGTFRLERAERLTVPLHLDVAALSDLVKMTPSARFWDEAAEVQLQALGLFRVTAAFEILVFVPVPS